MYCRVQLANYIESVSNPFESKVSNNLISLTTKESIEEVDYLLNVLEFGKRNYSNFIQERLIDKSKGFHEKISFKYESSYAVKENAITEKQKKVKLTTDDQENSAAVSFLQYALSRGQSVEHLLKYPITSRPVYLMEKDASIQKKAPKHELTTNLLGLLNKDSIIVNDSLGTVPHVKTTAVVIDFMSVTRRFSAVQMEGVQTFGSFTGKILDAAIHYGRDSDSIHIVLENYSAISVKSAERLRRATKVQPSKGLSCDVVSEQQKLPSSFDEFFGRTCNKISFQNFFVRFCIAHYGSEKPLYIAGGGESDPDMCIIIKNNGNEEAKEMRASHEEADDRIMFSINKIYSSHPENCSITVVSPDADIFVALLYHLHNSWQGLELYLLKKGRLKTKTVTQNELYPLHHLLHKVSPILIDSLPAGHALTGCDTVAKVGTKSNLLKVLNINGSMLLDFGQEDLNEEVIMKAEQFLLKIVASKSMSQVCLTFDDLRIKMYHYNRDKKFISLPCTSNEIRQHIRRAYLQARVWIESPFGNAKEVVDPEDCGYDSSLAPVWFIAPQKPMDIPEPCSTCKSCVKTSCPCRQKQSACSKFCRCGTSCKNPLNIQ